MSDDQLEYATMRVTFGFVEDRRVDSAAEWDKLGIRYTNHDEVSPDVNVAITLEGPADKIMEWLAANKDKIEGITDRTDVFCEHCGRELSHDEVKEIQDSIPESERGAVLGVVGNCCWRKHPDPQMDAEAERAVGPFEPGDPNDVWYVNLFGKRVEGKTFKTPEEAFDWVDSDKDK